MVPIARVLALGLALLAADPRPAQPPPDEATLRARRFELVRGIERTGVRDSATLAAMRAVPRHEFVAPGYRDQAYEDHPLPIECGQTISQPSLVAYMTELLRPRPGMKVLEVGTGSGYQAAVLAEIDCRVFTIEIFRELATSAAARLKRLGYRNAAVRHGDGYAGWPEQAPFDAIIVTAGAERIPRPLLEQLRPGGRMVIPVGSDPGDAELTLVEKDLAGGVHTRELLPVRFVPLLRGVR
jgi:protein-L-isoaspartate(D-aspartate) O-methyltransferase